MVGVTAIQRKILVLIYTLWKNDTVFDENHEAIRRKKKDLNTKAGSLDIPLPAQDEIKSNDLMFSLV